MNTMNTNDLERLARRWAKGNNPRDMIAQQLAAKGLADPQELNRILNSAFSITARDRKRMGILYIAFGGMLLAAMLALGVQLQSWQGAAVLGVLGAVSVISGIGLARQADGIRARNVRDQPN